MGAATDFTRGTHGVDARRRPQLARNMDRAQTDTGPMPGLASAADMERLRNAAGKDADTIFLTLMISHHQGGVTMAEAAAQRAAIEKVRSFAARMLASQNSEITAMQQILGH